MSQMIDTYTAKVELFKKHCLPLLSPKQAAEWYSKDWARLSRKKAYQEALAAIEAEVEAIVDRAWDLHDQLSDQVKADITEFPEFKYTHCFNNYGWPGFYLDAGRGYPQHGRNCVNISINPDDRTYTVYGTDGYKIGDLLADRTTAAEAMKIAKEWIKG